MDHHGDNVSSRLQADGWNADIPRKQFPLGRFGDEKNMGGTLLYLASGAGGYTTGTTMPVEGGILAEIASVL